MRRKLRINHRSKKLRKESRTISIFGSADRGDGRDSKRYWECWHCGFVCDVERDYLGGAEERATVKPIAYDQTEDDLSTAKYHCEGAAGATQTLCEAAGGTWSKKRYKPSVDSGCPFCGSPNWRGDF